MNVTRSAPAPWCPLHGFVWCTCERRKAAALARARGKARLRHERGDPHVLTRWHRPILPRWLSTHGPLAAFVLALCVGFVAGLCVAPVLDPPPRVFVAPCPELAP